METKAKLTESELTTALAHFTGSEQFYRHFTGMLYTEGVQYLAEQAGAYWLIDLAGSYQPEKKVKAEEFQVWTLKRNVHPKTHINAGEFIDSKAVIEMRADTNEPVIVRQRIPYTDFPMAEFSFWVVGGTMTLKSEY